MNNFFNKKKKDTDKKKAAAPTPQIRNPFAPKPNYGGGQSLGGTKPGKVLQISLSNPGPLGVRVERRSTREPSAIIAMVVPGSQANQAGLLRGDVVCHSNSNGQSEIPYKPFLEMASSTQRPMVFEVRRIESNIVVGSTTNKSSSKKVSSAEAEARKRAVAAAAEQRDKAHKTKTKPIPKTSLPTMTSTAEKRRQEQERLNNTNLTEEPMSAEAAAAIELAKQEEQRVTQELGYNPYQTKKASAGQARTATVNMTHGSIQADSGSKDNNNTATSAAAPNAVAAPANLQQVQEEQVAPVSEEFENAFTTLVTTNDFDVAVASLTIISKLVTNATTKGQSDMEDGSKFRRVRLQNQKIKENVADPHGALEVMLSVGFELLEQDSETLLVFPFPSKGPEWLPRALQTMQQYCKQQES